MRPLSCSPGLLASLCSRTGNLLGIHWAPLVGLAPAWHARVMSDDYWDRQRDYQRADDARYDRELAARDRAEADERGRRAYASGDTFNAIREVAGPDAALYYADRMGKDLDDPNEWPPNLIVISLDEFLANMWALPVGTSLRVEEVHRGQVEVKARDRAGGLIGTFWAPLRVAAEYLDHAADLVLSDRTERFVRDLYAALRSRRDI